MTEEKKSSLPQDIRPEWFNPIRSAQATCTQNNGLAILTMRVLVSGNEPIVWLSPELELIEPKRVAKNVVTHPEILGAVIALLSKTAGSESTSVDSA